MLELSRQRGHAAGLIPWGPLAGRALSFNDKRQEHRGRLRHPGVLLERPERPCAHLHGPTDGHFCHFTFLNAQCLLFHPFPLADSRALMGRHISPAVQPQGWAYSRGCISGQVPREEAGDSPRGGRSLVALETPVLRLWGASPAGQRGLLSLTRRGHLGPRSRCSSWRLQPPLTAPLLLQLQGPGRCQCPPGGLSLGHLPSSPCSSLRPGACMPRS